MPRLATPVVSRTTDAIRTRGTRARGTTPHRRLQSHIEPSPQSDLILGPLFLHTHDAVVIGDAHTGKVVKWNPSAERLFAWSVEDAVGQSIDSLISPAILPLYRAGMALYRDDETPRSFRVRVPRPDGGEVGVQLSLVSLDQRHFMVLGREDAVDAGDAPRPSREAEQSDAPPTAGVDLKWQRANLVPLVSRVVARARSLGKPHKLNIAVPQGLTATVDPERIEQVIEILLEQVFKRCPSGCWIDVDLRRPLTGLARLEVRDFGRPLDDATRQRVADSADADEDIMLARGVVEGHGGTLSFELPPDGGVRAVVTLPTQRGRVSATP